MNNLSVIILTNNVEAKLEDCLKSAQDLGEVIVLDGGSTDRTLEIAKNYKARVVQQKKGSYLVWRNQGRDEAKGEWLLYVDSDERITPELRKEIVEMIARGPAAVFPPEKPIKGTLSGGPPSRVTPRGVAAYAIPRRNFVFGKELKHGGWYPDYVIRLIRKDRLIKWEGELHEQPKIDGELGYFKNAFIHLKENNLSDMVEKTNKWSEIEAKLLLDSGHPPMAWWRFVRPVISEVIDRLIIKLGFLDGVKGIIFSVYQGYSVFMRYAKLWEMQKKRQ